MARTLLPAQTYDARNTRYTDQAGRTSSYAYDLVGNRTSTTYPGGVTVNRAHDGSNRVTALKDGSGNLQAAYGYDSLDRPTGMTLGNSTSVAYNYDLLNRVTSINNTLGGTVTRNYAYVYDAASRRTSETEPRGTVAYGYTNRNEVSAVTEPSGSPFSDQSFSYDAGFNRSNWTNGTTSTSYSVNNLNQYATVSGNAAPVWNGDGGLSSFTGNTYTYDALMRLTEVDNAGGKYLFSYDPTGRRVKKVIEGTDGTVLQTYGYHYDGSEVAVEYQPTTTYTYYLGLGIDQPVMRVNGSTKQWYYANAQGSISAVADNSGNVLEQYEYNAQGQFQAQDGSGTTQAVTRIGNFILYTGRNYDYETGNYFYRARYYSPVLGRFVSRDPLSGAEFSQGTNLYAYCGNNFLNASDPTGMCKNQGVQALGWSMHGGNGIAQITTTSGQTYTASTPAELEADLQTVINAGDTVSDLSIVGHATSGYQTLGSTGQVSASTYGDGSGMVTTATSGDEGSSLSDDTTLFNTALAPGANVYLGGCDTAEGSSNVTQAFSNAVPAANVTGNDGVAFGIPGVGSYCPFGQTTYVGGKAQ